VVGEVLSQHRSPFFPSGALAVPRPRATREEYDRRWAGLKAPIAGSRRLPAPNRPGRRAGVAQIFLNGRSGGAVAEISWIPANSLTGAILLPRRLLTVAGSALRPLLRAIYAACGRSRLFR